MAYDNGGGDPRRKKKRGGNQSKRRPVQRLTNTLKVKALPPFAIVYTPYSPAALGDVIALICAPATSLTSHTGIHSFGTMGISR